MLFKLLSLLICLTSANSDPVIRIADELIARKHDTLFWEPSSPTSSWLSKHEGGTTAVVTLALASAGKDVENAANQLWSIQSPHAYVRSLRLLLWNTNIERYRERATADVKALVQRFNTDSLLQLQFCLMALQESHRNGIQINSSYWKQIAEQLLHEQRHDGGWGYPQQKDSKHNLTVAGLNCLLAITESAQHALTQSQHETISQHSQQAADWLQNNPLPTTNPGGTSFMSFFFTLERVAMCCGFTRVGGQDWYLLGKQEVLKSHCKPRTIRGANVNLAFALLFLARGDAPYLVCEFTKEHGTIPRGQLSQHVSNNYESTTEQDATWKQVTLDEEVLHWLDAPLLLCVNENAIAIPTSHMKSYVNSGGTVVAVISKSQRKQFSELMNQSFPHFSKRDITNQHWSQQLFNKTTRIRGSVWENGVRDVVICFEGTLNNRGKFPPNCMDALTNIALGVSELGQLKDRSEVKDAQCSIPCFLADEFTEDSQIPTSGAILLGGLRGAVITTELITQMIDFATRGGTIIVESLGHRNQFTQNVQEHIMMDGDIELQQETMFHQSSNRRGWSLQHQQQVQPLFYVEIGSGRIYFAHFDIRHAFSSTTSWQIHGFDRQTTLELLDTIVKEHDST